MVSRIYTNLPVRDIVRLPHPRSGESQGQETFLAPSADKQTRNYDTECYIYIYICMYVCMYKWSQVIRNTQSAQISQKQDGRNIYVIMKTMYPPGCHHNGFMSTHAPGHMMYGYTLLVPMNQRVLNKVSVTVTSNV